MRTWKALTIFCVSFFVCYLAPVVINLACGPQIDPYDYYTSFFHSNLTGKKGYEPFQHTLYDLIYRYDEPEDEKTINAKEWAKYLGHSVKYRDVQKAMYELAAGTDSILLRNYFPKKRLPDSLAKNSFLRCLLLRRNAAPLKYYTLIKTAEKSVSPDNLWQPSPPNNNAIRNNGDTALKIALAEKDSFLKLRYLFQAQRYFQYSGLKKEAADVYDRYIARYPSASHVKGWAMSLKAGALYALNRDAEAAYLFSKVFAQYPERRVQAYLSYRWAKQTPEQVCRYAKNDFEKATIYGIAGINTPDMDLKPLKMVYHYNPGSALFTILLSREVNKIEDGYLSPRLEKALNYSYFNNIYAYNAPVNISEKRYREYIEKLKTFCAAVGNGKSTNAPLGDLTLAYLAWIQNRPAEGLAAIDHLDHHQLTTGFSDQKQLINLLLLTRNITHMDSLTEQKLLPGLQWLAKKTKHEVDTAPKNESIYSWGAYDDKPFASSARDFYQKILAPIYLKQGDTTKAALAFFKSDIESVHPSKYHMLYGQNILPDVWQNYLHSSNLKKLISYKAHPPENSYLRLLAEPLARVKKDDLYELTGTACLREHNYADAVQLFSKMSSRSLNHFAHYNFNDDDLKSNPFISQLNDYPKKFNYKNQKGYNKLMFAKAMLRLQKLIKTDPKQAPENYFKLATGLYNTSHDGNAWYLISYTWSSDNDDRNGQRFYYDDDLIDAKNAERLFVKAALLSPNPEFKARCMFMAAKCAQHRVRYPSWRDGASESKTYKASAKRYTDDMKHQVYFTALKQRYSKTRFFKTAMEECSYLRDFINPQPVKPKPVLRVIVK